MGMYGMLLAPCDCGFERLSQCDGNNDRADFATDCVKVRVACETISTLG